MTTAQIQMLQILREMRDAQIANTPPQGNQSRDRSTRVNRRTPDNATFNRLDKSKYCHTHGAYNHQSSECNRKAPGHRNAAMLANRLGGSNAFFQRVQNAE